MKYYQINREERHFGFLFVAALISNPAFRKVMFDLLNSRASLSLNHEDFDVYAEVAIFRDHWNSLGDPVSYDTDVHAKRLTMLTGILECMGIDRDLIQSEEVFWTAGVGTSKLWFPGKWSESKIQTVESKVCIDDKRLWRCRWLCNAKPDIMIHSGDSVLLIEVKVESGMGASDKGYDQEQTQEDIISVGKQVLDWMQSSTVNRLTLTHNHSPAGITWNQVVEIYAQTRTKLDPGNEMIQRHFAYMPKAKEPIQSRRLSVPQNCGPIYPADQYSATSRRRTRT